MIASCPECSARFRIPDEKMKPGGVKVRCSRCKHVFTAGAEGDPDGPMATGTPMPAPTPMPSMPSMPSVAPGGGEAMGIGGDHTAAISFEEAQRTASENLLLGLPSSLQDLGPAPISPAPGSPAPSSPAPSSPAPSLDLGPPPDMGIAPDVGPPPGGAFDIAPPPGASFGDIAPAGGSPGPPPGAGAAPGLALDDGKPPGGVAASPPASAPRTRTSSPEMRTASDHKPLATRSSVGMMLFMTLLAFNGVCVWVLFKNDWRADLRRANDMFRVAVDAEAEVMLPAAKPAVPRLELTDVRARTLRNDEERTILIVDGLAKNSGDVPVRDVIVSGRLLDSQDDDKAVRKAAAPATGRLDKDQLRAVRTLSDVQRAYRSAKKAAPLTPGAEAAFTVVFPGLPGDFDVAKERYRFEVQIGAYEEALEGAEPAAEDDAGDAKAKADEADEGADDTEDSEGAEPVEEFMGPPAPG